MLLMAGFGGDGFKKVYSAHCAIDRLPNPSMLMT